MNKTSRDPKYHDKRNKYIASRIIDMFIYEKGKGNEFDFIEMLTALNYTMGYVISHGEKDYERACKIIDVAYDQHRKYLKSVYSSTNNIDK